MPLNNMIEGSAIAAVITDPGLPDNPIVACNDAFLELTGYSREEVVGRNCRFLAGPAAEPLLRDELAEAIRERRPLVAEIPNFKKDGTPFINAVVIVPVFDADGRLEYFFGSQAEVRDKAADGGSGKADGASAKLAALTPRQAAVLAYLVQGKRNKEIAKLLGITERTVKMHRAALLVTLGVGTSADAIRLAVETGWYVDRLARI
jgi:PAS domain S-box-containing protein